MVKRRDDGLAKLKNDDDISIGGVVDLVKAYALQETVQPMKGAGKWIGLGLAGALLMSVGATFLLLGLLRVLQAEWTWSARGSFSWVSYLIVLVACALLIYAAVRRISGSSLNDPKDID